MTTLLQLAVYSLAIHGDSKTVRERAPLKTLHIIIILNKKTDPFCSTTLLELQVGSALLHISGSEE